jgi:hypothetical protein
MQVQDLDTTDPAALEAALDAAPLHTLARVVTSDGQVLHVHRVPGGWHLEGDLTVASGDIADGRPSAVSLLLGEDFRGDEGWQILADPDVAAWAQAQRSEYLSPETAIERARAAFARGDAEEAEASTRELDDLASVGWSEAGVLRDQIQAWLDLFGEDPYDERDGQ